MGKGASRKATPGGQAVVRCSDPQGERLRRLSERRSVPVRFLVDLLVDHHLGDIEARLGPVRVEPRAATGGR